MNSQIKRYMGEVQGLKCSLCGWGTSPSPHVGVFTNPETL